MDAPYFFTALDAQYLAHTPRDPLGFQVIWVAPARKVIPDLSTVSASARDFQILSYARYFCRREGDGAFLRFREFFYRFEQACGFARLKYGGERGFNGIDRVSRRVAGGDSDFAVSGNPAAHGDLMLMSNQRGYGIYGKYIRPYTDMNIDADPEFDAAMDDAFGKTGDREAVQRLMRRLLAEKPGGKITIHKSELELLFGLVMTRTPAERDFFVRKILRGDKPGSLQWRFFELVRAHPELSESGDGWRFHGFVKQVLELTKSDPDLNRAFVEIRNTEKVLYPLWAIFAAFLNNRPFWNKRDIADEPFFSAGFSRVDCVFSPPGGKDVRDALNALLDGTLSAEERMRELVGRNREISERRGGLPWVRDDNDRYVVLAKGARPPEAIDQENGNVNSYFLPGYLHLYRELTAAAAAAEPALPEASP